LHGESLSLRQVFRQRYLELSKQGFGREDIITEPTEPSNYLDLDGSPFLGNENLDLGPLQVGK
jgi:hypothetical protein